MQEAVLSSTTPTKSASVIDSSFLDVNFDRRDFHKLTLGLLAGVMGLRTQRGKAGELDTPRSDRKSGSIIIVGGNTTPAKIIDEICVRGTSASGAFNLLIVPTSEKNEKEHQISLTLWRKNVSDRVKGGIVNLFHTNDRRQANDHEYVAPIRDATALWFPGGDQELVAEAYAGTLAWQEFMNVLFRRGLIAGTSSGAAIMSDPMIADWHTENGKRVPLMKKGLGFVPGAIVEQHYLQRIGRVGRLDMALELHPDFIGIGVDEKTAAVLDEAGLSVLGDSTVTIITRDRVKHVLQHGDSRRRNEIGMSSMYTADTEAKIVAMP